MPPFMRYFSLVMLPIAFSHARRRHDFADADFLPPLHAHAIEALRYALTILPPVPLPAAAADVCYY